MRYENLSKRLNRYTILFLIIDFIILLIDLFDFCKKHIAYTKISIFYIWQFNYKNAIYGYIKLLVLVLISICYFAFYDYSVTPMIILALIGICIMLIVIKRTLKLRKL